MKYIIGLFISTVGFFLASQHLKQDIETYWDYVAFFVVILGTFSVMLITFPASNMRNLITKFSHKFFMPGHSLKHHVHECYSFYKNKKSIIKPTTIEEKILNDGLELMELGFSKEKVQDIISQRFELHSKHLNMLSAWLRRGAKYPPAFGLAGTVLGLIHLMRGVSAGIDAKETGVRMAVALVATFYGLLLSNLLLNPLGEWLNEEIKRDEMKAEASLKTILLIMEGSGVLEAQEILNSFLNESEKIQMNYAQLIEETA